MSAARTEPGNLRAERYATAERRVNPTTYAFEARADGRSFCARWERAEDGATLETGLSTALTWWWRVVDARGEVLGGSALSRDGAVVAGLWALGVSL